MTYFLRHPYSCSFLSTGFQTLRKPATAGLLLLGLCANSAHSQSAPVVDAVGTQALSAQPLLAQNTNSGNEMVMSLYMQLEQLQREVQSLRGLVEEQAYQIRRMETEQRDRYLDLDRRLSGGAGVDAGIGENIAGTGLDSASGTESLNAAGMQPIPVPGRESVSDNLNPGNQPGQDVAGISGQGFGTATPSTSSAFPNAADMTATGQETQASSLPPATPENEQQIYRDALSFLLEEQRYEEAIEQFQFYVDNYPDGRYLTNAYYWKGEALLLVERYEEAQTAFQTVVENYPLDPKAAGSLLKLGVAYRELGQEGMAREIWQRLRSEYPSSLSEISVADDYLSRLGQ